MNSEEPFLKKGEEIQKEINMSEEKKQSEDKKEEVQETETPVEKVEETKEEVKAEVQTKEERTQTVIVKGKKKKKKEPFLRGGRGQAHIKATYNNTIVTITDLNGATLAWASAGKCGFKGPKKATPYAAGVIVKSIIPKIKEYNIKEVDVYVKGVGSGRESAVRAISAGGIHLASIKDVMRAPHGGCRPKKPRRI
jgi:small subunit ribosomal protein S11